MRGGCEKFNTGEPWASTDHLGAITEMIRYSRLTIALVSPKWSIPRSSSERPRRER
jgi:hypothetical protein